jgi:hypothetical protein
MTEEAEKKDDLEFLDELGLEDFQEYEELFKVVGEYKQGKVTRDALKEKLFELRFRKLSDEDLDRIVGETEFTKDGLVSIFNCIIFLKKIIDAGTKEKFQRIKKREGMGLFRVLDKSNYKRKARPYSDKEKNKYAKLINKALKDDADCKNKLPIDPKGDDLYEKLRDGVILSKLVNLCEPNTINEDDIKKNDDMNVYDKYANLEKAIKGAKDIGIQCETNPDDVLDKDKARDNDLLGEIFARLNTKKKDIKENPETPKLAEGGEAPEQIADLPVDDFLKKWFNHHLKEANHPDELKNFEDDVKDSEKYTVLLNQLDPNQCDKSALDETDPVERAKKVIDNAKKLGCETEVTPEDIASGNEAMNRLFTSDLYNAVANNAGGDDYDKDLMKAYIDTINKELCDDADTKNKVPIDKDNEEVFDKLKDGVIFGKLMNLADKDALDEDTLKTGDELSDDDKNNNLDKVVDGADKLGCPHKASKDDIANGKKKKDQDLLGDVLGKIKVTPKLVKEDPDADDLVQEGETKDDLANKVPIDDFLKRWTNKHLKLAESPRVMNNYDDDLKDGEIFTILLNDIAPETCDKSPLDESDPVKRAEKVIENARKLGVDTAVPPEGLANGNPELTKLFLGEIYNAYANPFDANEKECYCKMINKLLGDDPELKDKLPVDPKSNDIFKKMKDGVILSKLINLAAPGTVDERVIVKDPGMKQEDKLNNLNLTINSAKSIGCLIEATPEDVLDEVRTKDVDLLYQILKQIALKKISVQDFPQLLRLKEGKETDEELLTFGPEDFLKRWFNHHLTKANHPNKLNNFSDDVKDSEKYTILLNQLDPDKCNTDGLNEGDLKKRAGTVLENAPKIGAEVFIKDEDIPNGNEHLNTLFTAELFMANNGMGEATQEEKMTANKILEDDDEGAREERSFKTWINSLKLEGVKKVNNLYEECRSAILLLKMIDKIKPGTVDWKKVELKTKNPFKIGVNCQEVIDSAKRSGYSIISIGNKDIQEGKKKHILAIVWQLMRAHTLKIIGEKSEEELISWANSRVSEGRRIKSLKEKKLNDGLFWIELLSSIEKRCIRWELVVKENLSDKDKEMNAKYALSVARGLGAMIFVVWEDITEVKSKLLLTFLASLYDVAQTREKKN